MKSKKKTSQKASAQTAPTAGTLRDFFNTKASSNGQADKRQQNSSKRKNTTTTQREVIIIDSDSDDSDVPEIVPVTSGAKRRKLSPPARPEAPAGSSIKIERAATPPVSYDRQAESPAGTTAQLSVSGFSFGDPFLLTERAPVSSTNATSDDPLEPWPCNDQPVAGPSRPRLAPLQDEAECSRAGLSSENSRSRESQVDIDLTIGPWETGDDESSYPGACDPPMGVVDDAISHFEDPEGIPYDIEDEEAALEDDLQSLEHESKKSDAFTRLMLGYKENQAWKEAERAEDRSFRPSKSNRRKAPFYKVLQGMPIAVDAFKYGSIPGVTAYFLTHAHSDHYTNLSSSWTSGPIYCSEGTANLIVHMLSVDKKWVRPLPMDKATVIPNTGGVQVTLIEANHCPGSCLFFFEGPQTVDAGDNTFKSPHVGSSKIFRYLHCGDFRASPRHVLHPAVKGKRIDHVYLDTTYLDPKYTFPPQALVISACAGLAEKLAVGAPPIIKPSGVFSWLKSGSTISETKPQPKAPTKPVLFVIGTYSIGKERIVKAVAKALNTKVYCDKRKAAILRCQADPELNALMTSNANDASVHLLPLGMITSDKLATYFDSFKGKYAKVIGFRPTGWTYVQPSGTEQLPSIDTILNRTVQKTFTFEDLKPSKQSTSTLQLYPVPYSEHSSFYELTCFAMSLNWGKMIATVNVGSEKSRAKMAKWVSKWEAERKKRKEDVVTHRHLDYW